MSQAHRLHSAEQAIEQLAGLPGGPELLAAAQRHGDVALVGGAVRDLLLGHWPRELDVTVEHGAAAFADDLAASVSPSERAYGQPVEPVLHERFGTASVAWQYGRIDIAERRAESYPAPGALPEVRPGTVDEDLARRDFTVNAIALPLAGEERGRLRALDGALDDLEAGSLRVLHEQSFLDDPTRILRLARYAARLGFEIEPGTRALAQEAVAAGALDSVSGGRVGAELWLAAEEPDGRASFRALDSLGVLAALKMPSPFDDRLAQQAEALLPLDGSRAIVRMAVALHPQPDDGGETAVPSIELMQRLEFTSQSFKAVFSAANGVEGLAGGIVYLTEQAKPGALDDSSTESLAVAGALAARTLPAASDTVRAWFATHRHVKLEIDGGDLVAAGVPEGPEVGYRLAAVLQRKREGLLAGRDQELPVALEIEVPAPGTPIET